MKNRFIQLSKGSIAESLRRMLASAEQEETVETNLAEAKTEDGTTIQAEVFEVGATVFVVDAEGQQMPVEPGVYVLEGIGAVSVDDNSTITEIVTESVEETTETEEEVEMSAELKAVEELKAQLAELKTQVETLSKEKEEAATELSSVKEAKEVVDKEVEELKVKLSEEPATTKPLQHAPEATKLNKANVLIGQSRRLTKQDKMMNKLANLHRKNS